MEMTSFWDDPTWDRSYRYCSGPLASRAAPRYLGSRQGSGDYITNVIEYEYDYFERLHSSTSTSTITTKMGVIEYDYDYFSK